MSINETVMESNECFGCGHDNEHGLQIEIRKSPDGGIGLVGTLMPKEHMTGFPGIVHGGVVYSALDCLAAWTATVLRPEKAIWILRSANVKYVRPTYPGTESQLSSRIVEQGDEMKPITVDADARDENGALLVKARFTVVPLDPERFLEVSGLKEIPANWLKFMSLGAGAK